MQGRRRIDGEQVAEDLRGLGGAGMEMKLANPLKTRAIAEARVKTDKLDSKLLVGLVADTCSTSCRRFFSGFGLQWRSQRLTAPPHAF